MTHQEAHEFDAQGMHALQPLNGQLSTHLNDNIQIVRDILWAHQLRVNVVKLQACGKDVLVAAIEQIHLTHIWALTK